MARIIVIGGTVLDVQAQPDGTDLQRGSSVPGKVVQVPGGVGRNIAEAAHNILLQSHPAQPPGSASVLLVSVVGRDAAGDALMASFRHAGMSTDGVIRSSDVSTPCVVAVLDAGGEVAACVADVAAPAAALTPAVVQQHAAALRRAGLLVLDANLEPPTLVAAAKAAAAAGVPVLCEPVSVPKSARCVPVLGLLACITPNANELLEMAAAVRKQAGLPQLPPLPAAAAGPLQLLAQLAPAAASVLQTGLKQILLTLGSQGAALLTLQPAACSQHLDSSSSSNSGNSGSSRPGRQQLLAQHIPAAPAAVINLSGAGDTLTGTFAAALVAGSSPEQALAMGVAAAGVAVECRVNVPGPADGLVLQRVQLKAQQLLAGMQTWTLPLAAAL